MTNDALTSRRISLEAHVASWVTMGRGCVVHPFAVVGRVPSRHKSLARLPDDTDRWLEIGEGTEISPHAIVYAGARIGRDCLIGDAANIREGVTVGDRCIIGCRVSIGYEAVLGNDVRVQNGTHVTDGAVVGDGTFIGVNVSMSSDRRRDVVDYEFKGSCGPTIGKRCLIGSGACLVPGVHIGDGAVIGAGALVVKDVPAGATVLGEPARVRMQARAVQSLTTVDWPLSAAETEALT